MQRYRTWRGALAVTAQFVANRWDATLQHGTQRGKLRLHETWDEVIRKHTIQQRFGRGVGIDRPVAQCTNCLEGAFECFEAFIEARVMATMSVMLVGRQEFLVRACKLLLVE